MSSNSLLSSVKLRGAGDSGDNSGDRFIRNTFTLSHFHLMSSYISIIAVSMLVNLFVNATCESDDDENC